MFDVRRYGVEDAGALRMSGVFGGRVRALGLALLLACACGGKAEGVAPGDDEDTQADGPRVGAGGTPASSPARPSRGGSDDSRSVSCYSPDEIESAPLLQEVLPFLPQDAFDSNGCLAAGYSNWLVAGGCTYDSNGASLRGGQCCYELDDPVPDCDRGPR